MTTFGNRDPARPGFWDERFDAGFTPWDQGGVPAALIRYVERTRSGLGARVLIPGCGSGYEAAWLEAKGFAVTAIDFSATAIERARHVLAPAVADRVLRQADFFDLAEPPFDWLYERAFLAALPPALWPRWADALARYLRADGLLAGLFFVGASVPEPKRGPPFAVTAAELQTLLGHAFERIEDAEVPAAESLPVFAGSERWMAWRRR